MIETIFSYPITYAFSILLVGVLAAEAIFIMRAPWRMTYLAVLGTISAWYLIEPVYMPEAFAEFDTADVSDAFMSVVIFFLALRVLTPLFAQHGNVDRSGQVRNTLDEKILQRMFWAMALIWCVLFAIGAERVGGVFAALYPNGRTGIGGMWGRWGVGTGFGDAFIAAAGYIYLLVLASFGMILVLVRSWKLRALCLVAIAISWPYAFLLGARNTALAVLMPGLLAFFLYGRARLWVKAVAAVASYEVINEVMLLMIAYRNIGFDRIGSVDLDTVRHYGLNMATELTYITSFLRTGVLDLQWGYAYFVDLTQIVPRALWPDKPTIGYDYAIARGFAANRWDGVTATVAEGLIGQGVRQFGIFFGPIAAAALMAGWTRVLTNLQTDPRISRTCIFLLGLGVTFNLGRDFTLLVLWPFVMAYAGIHLLEFVMARTGQRTRRSHGNSQAWAATRSK